MSWPWAFRFWILDLPSWIGIAAGLRLVRELPNKSRRPSEKRRSALPRFVAPGPHFDPAAFDWATGEKPQRYKANAALQPRWGMRNSSTTGLLQIFD